MNFIKIKIICTILTYYYHKIHVLVFNEATIASCKYLSKENSI